MSPDCGRAGYLLLTSSNLSKAAWGSLNKAKDSLLVMSYEAGVLLLPKFVSLTQHFDLGATQKNGLMLPYDLPLSPYKAGLPNCRKRNNKHLGSYLFTDCLIVGIFGGWSL
jgi:hypothetical protein